MSSQIDLCQYLEEMAESNAWNALCQAIADILPPPHIAPPPTGWQDRVRARYRILTERLPPTQEVTLWLPPALHRTLLEAAAALEITPQALIRMAIRDWLADPTQEDRR